MEDNRIMKLDDSVLDEVSGGVVTIRHAVYKQDIDGTHAGFADLNNTHTANPAMLGDLDKSTAVSGDVTSFGETGGHIKNPPGGNKVSNMGTWA